MASSIGGVMAARSTAAYRPHRRRAGIGAAQRENEVEDYQLLKILYVTLSLSGLQFIIFPIM